MPFPRALLYILTYICRIYLEFLFPSVPVEIVAPVRGGGLKTEHLSPPAGICQSWFWGPKVASYSNLRDIREKLHTTVQIANVLRYRKKIKGGEKRGGKLSTKALSHTNTVLSNIPFPLRAIPTFSPLIFVGNIVAAMKRAERKPRYTLNLKYSLKSGVQMHWKCWLVAAMERVWLCDSDAFQSSNVPSNHIQYIHIHAGI